MAACLLSLQEVIVPYKTPSTIAVSGKLLLPLSTKLYISARLVVVMSYLAPCVSCNKDQLLGFSFSIHCSKFFICLPFFLFVPGGSMPGKSHKPIGSSSANIATCAATAAACATFSAAFLSLTWFLVNSFSLSHNNLNFFP